MGCGNRVLASLQCQLGKDCAYRTQHDGDSLPVLIRKPPGAAGRGREARHWHICWGILAYVIFFTFILTLWHSWIVCRWPKRISRCVRQCRNDSVVVDTCHQDIYHHGMKMELHTFNKGCGKCITSMLPRRTDTNTNHKTAEHYHSALRGISVAGGRGLHVCDINYWCTG